jgi:hypothetical protein
MHDGYGSDLILGEFVRPFEIVDLDLALIRRGMHLFGADLTGGYRCEQLIYFVL